MEEYNPMNGLYSHYKQSLSITETGNKMLHSFKGGKPKRHKRRKSKSKSKKIYTYRYNVKNNNNKKQYKSRRRK